MKLILPFLSALILAGCLVATTTLPSGPLSPSQVYAGYPCLDHCEAFKAGYEQAKADNLTSPTHCDQYSDSQIIGCKAFVNDYQYSINPDPDLIQSLESTPTSN